MPNEYVRYAEVTVSGKIGVRTRSWNDGSKVVQTARIESNDPIIKSKSFRLEHGSDSTPKKGGPSCRRLINSEPLEPCSDSRSTNAAI